jgi:hypothetical protein
MPLSPIPCPQCQKMGAQFLRSVPRKTYFCEDCLKEFFDEEDGLNKRMARGAPAIESPR